MTSRKVVDSIIVPSTHLDFVHASKIIAFRQIADRQAMKIPIAPCEHRSFSLPDLYKCGGLAVGSHGFRPAILQHFVINKENAP